MSLHGTIVSFVGVRVWMTGQVTMNMKRQHVNNVCHVMMLACLHRCRCKLSEAPMHRSKIPERAREMLKLRWRMQGQTLHATCTQQVKQAKAYWRIKGPVRSDNRTANCKSKFSERLCRIATSFAMSTGTGTTPRTC